MPLPLRHWVGSTSIPGGSGGVDQDGELRVWPPLHQSLIPVEIVGQLVAVGKGTDIHNMYEFYEKSTTCNLFGTLKGTLSLVYKGQREMGIVLA